MEATFRADLHVTAVEVWLGRVGSGANIGDLLTRRDPLTFSVHSGAEYAELFRMWALGGGIGPIRLMKDGLPRGLLWVANGPFLVFKYRWDPEAGERLVTKTTICIYWAIGMASAPFRIFTLRAGCWLGDGCWYQRKWAQRNALNGPPTKGIYIFFPFSQLRPALDLVRTVWS